MSKRMISAILPTAVQYGQWWMCSRAQVCEFGGNEGPKVHCVALHEDAVVMDPTKPLNELSFAEAFAYMPPPEANAAGTKQLSKIALHTARAERAAAVLEAFVEQVRSQGDVFETFCVAGPNFGLHELPYVLAFAEAGRRMNFPVMVLCDCVEMKEAVRHAIAPHILDGTILLRVSMDNLVPLRTSPDPTLPANVPKINRSTATQKPLMGHVTGAGTAIDHLMLLRQDLLDADLERRPYFTDLKRLDSGPMNAFCRNVAFSVVAEPGGVERICAIKRFLHMLGQASSMGRHASDQNPKALEMLVSLPLVEGPYGAMQMHPWFLDPQNVDSFVRELMFTEIGDISANHVNLRFSFEVLDDPTFIEGMELFKTSIARYSSRPPYEPECETTLHVLNCGVIRVWPDGRAFDMVGYPETSQQADELAERWAAREARGPREAVGPERMKMANSRFRTSSAPPRVRVTYKGGPVPLGPAADPA
jgi:hypothetical protein